MTDRAQSKRHILVVDDDPLVCQTVEMLLSLDGHDVAEANSAREALAAFEPGKFDVIFTDYFMPAMKGDELAAAIKKRSPSQPVVMVTAYPEIFESPEDQQTGIDFFIGKPFLMENLREAIRRFAPVEKNKGKS